jgi:hypothetical protein
MNDKISRNASYAMQIIRDGSDGVQGPRATNQFPPNGFISGCRSGIRLDFVQPNGAAERGLALGFGVEPT